MTIDQFIKNSIPRSPLFYKVWCEDADDYEIFKTEKEAKAQYIYYRQEFGGTVNVFDYSDHEEGEQLAELEYEWEDYV
jgi:hypothetical protein